MNPPSETARDLALLENIELDPNVTQATLAVKLDVAVGTINWHLKRLIDKGYVKIKRAERKKLRYIITPEGIALRAVLTVDYIEQQFHLYRNTRQKVREQLEQVRSAGFEKVAIRGQGDVADICRLSCLEQGIQVVEEADVPVLEITGLNVFLKLKDGIDG